MYIIDQNNKTPLHIQLYDEIKKEIISNCKIGDKLDSIRKVASIYNLSKNTVESAYSQLVAEGYIDSIPRSSYIVTDTNLKDFDFEQKQPYLENNNSKEIEENYLYDFYPARL